MNKKLDLDALTTRVRMGNALTLAEELSLIALARQRDALLATAKALMPSNVCLTNPNVSDDIVVPCDITMGELRRATAAIRACEGE